MDTKLSRPADLYLLMTVVGVTAAFAPLPPVVRALLIVPLVLWLPGYGVIRAILPGRWPPLETIVISCGLSLAICVMSGIALHLMGAMTRTGWTLLLGLVCAASYLTTNETHTARWQMPSINATSCVAAALALLLAGAAVHIAQINARSHQEFLFSELWLVPSQSSSNSLTVGISNRESGSTKYSLQVRTDGRVTSQWEDISLEPGATWTADIATPALKQNTKRWRVEATLFKDGNTEEVYRRAWATSDVRKDHSPPSPSPDDEPLPQSVAAEAQ